MLILQMRLGVMSDAHDQPMSWLQTAWMIDVVLPIATGKIIITDTSDSRSS